MRGTTVKKLGKFADLLILNTRKDDPNPKTKPQLMKELKVHWKTQGKNGQKFIREALS
jgi:hypothetical protein